MAQFQILDIYAQENGSAPVVIRTVSADSMSVEGSSAVFTTGGITTAIFALSSQFVIEKVS